MPIVTQLHVYPVKSMQGIPLENAELTVRGLQYDRNWMVINEEARSLTQRELPQLASIQIGFSDNQLKFTDSNENSISVPLEANHKREVETQVWGDRCEALDEGDEISEWLNETLGQSKHERLRLVRFKEEFRRFVDQEYLKGEDAHTAFSDGFPFLITTEESLSALNDRLLNKDKNPVSMDRFRPNIVIKGLKPFQENQLGYLASADGRYKFGIRKPCKRCKVTTVDQKSGGIANPKEPLRTLTQMKTIQDRKGAFFGQNTTLLRGVGTQIRKGDVLEFVTKEKLL